MTKDELKLAFQKAFQMGQDYWYYANHEFESYNKKSDAIRAKFNEMVKETIEEALAQPEQEPVAWEQFYPDIGKPQIAFNAEVIGYVASQQGPVAWGVFEGNLHDMFFSPSEAQEMADLKGTHAEVRPLYTTPPQRKPLTLGQKQRLWSSVGDKPTLKDRVNAYGLAIEAAHGIKE